MSKTTKTNQTIEDRISNEILVDTYNEQEQAAGWYCYLEDNLEFPFSARCILKRQVSPLKKGEEVEVINIADQEECEGEIFVIIKYQNDELAVSLAQLEPVKASVKTKQAAVDWHYWVKMGYQF